MAKARSTTPTPRRAQAKPGPVNDIPTLEWIAAGVGLILACTAIGLTGWDALFGVEGPPAIEVRLKQITPTSHGYVAEIEAYNHGGAPAAQVQVEGLVEGSDPTSVTIDYIPERSRASAGMIFERDPRQANLKLRARGFVDAF